MIHISNFHLREIERRRRRTTRAEEIAKERPLLFKILKFNSFVFVPASIPRRNGPHAALAHSYPYKYVWRHYFAYKCACWTSIQLDVFNKCVVGAKIDDYDRSTRSIRTVSLTGALVLAFPLFCSFLLSIPASMNRGEGESGIFPLARQINRILSAQKERKIRPQQHLNIIKVHFMRFLFIGKYTDHFNFLARFNCFSYQSRFSMGLSWFDCARWR